MEVVNRGLQGMERWTPPDIRGVGTTGSGRELIGELIGADIVTDEITAHKTGSTFVGTLCSTAAVPTPSSRSADRT